MNGHDQLSQLLQAERSERRPETAAEQGWRGLHGALHANVTGLAVAHGPLKLGLSAASKWLLGSGLAVAVVGSGLALRLEPPLPPAPVPAAIASAAGPTLLAPLPTHPPEPAPATTLESAPASKRLAVPSATPSSAPSATTAISTLAEELRFMKAAKLALDGGRNHLAQVWLDEHARLYPEGVFLGEREALRVLLACRQGSGRDAAQRYLAQHPQSPFIDRIARACQLDQATPPAARSPDQADAK